MQHMAGNTDCVCCVFWFIRFIRLSKKSWQSQFETVTTSRLPFCAQIICYDDNSNLRNWSEWWKMGWQCHWYHCGDTLRKWTMPQCQRSWRTATKVVVYRYTYVLSLFSKAILRMYASFSSQVWYAYCVVQEIGGNSCHANRLESLREELPVCVVECFKWTFCE